MSEVIRSHEAATAAVTSAIAAFAPSAEAEAAMPQTPYGETPAAMVKTIDQQPTRGPSVGVGRAVFDPRARAARRDACTDAILDTEPEDIGLKTPADLMKEGGKGYLRDTQVFIGRRLGPLNPYVTLSPVDAGGKPCYDNLVQRKAILAARINGRWGRARSHIEGNGGGAELTNLGYSRAQLCGRSVQAVLRVEADTDGRAGNDPAVVFKSPEEQAVCR